MKLNKQEQVIEIHRVKHMNRLVQLESILLKNVLKLIKMFLFP